MSTSFAVCTSNGSEIGEYGTLAAWITADSGEGYEPLGWTSNTVQAPMAEDGMIDGDVPTLLAAQIAEAKAEVERRVGRALEWDEISKDAGNGGEAVAQATV